MSATIKRNWGVVLFAIPFAAVGIGFLLSSVLPALYDWQQMKSWTAAEARLDHAELRVNRGEDSDTYQVIARYTYRYGGEEYVSDRVGILGGSDNIGSYHKSLAHQLRAARSAGRPVTVWVNPSIPAESVLDRNMRWDAFAFNSIFALVFGAVGIGILLWGLLGKADVIKHPDSASKPWLGYRPWSNSVIPCNSKSGLWVMWFFAAIWNAISSFVWFIIPEELAKGNYAVLIAGLFPLVGLGLLGSAVYMTLGWRRFGSVAVTLDPYPGAIGGQVGGTIDLRLPYNQQHRFSVALSCVYSYESGSGKNRSRKERLVWQASGFADSEPEAAGTRLNFCFDVPPDLPASQPSATQYHLWRLVLAADLPGVDLKREFELPVFPTGEKSMSQQQNSVNHVHAVEHREALIESVLDIEQIPGGVELYFPMLRNLGPKVVWLVFGSVFGGAGLAMGRANDAPTFMVLIFSAIGAFTIIYTIYALFNSLRVRIDQSGISTERRWLGLPLGRSFAGRSDISSLQVHTSYSRQTGNEHVDICKIQAHTRSGKKITVAESLTGRDAAMQAMESIGLLSNYPIEK